MVMTGTRIWKDCRTARPQRSADPWNGFTPFGVKVGKPCLNAGPEGANGIAASVGGKITFDHPGSPAATAFISFGSRKNTPSFSKMVGRLESAGFASYLNLNPEHFGGADF